MLGYLDSHTTVVYSFIWMVKSTLICAIYSTHKCLHSGSADVSPDYRYLAVLRIRQGLAVFDLHTRDLCEEMPLDMGPHAVPLPIQYIHDGAAIATGSNTGKVRLWNTDGQKPCQMQKLVHGEPHANISIRHAQQPQSTNES